MVFCRAVFSRPFTATRLVNGSNDDTTQAVLSFGDAGGEVLVQVGLSAVDADGARNNLDLEWAEFDFSATRRAANETNCMIGYHAVSFIADAWLKGLRGYDGELALQAMLASARQLDLGAPTPVGRTGHTVPDSTADVFRRDLIVDLTGSPVRYLRFRAASYSTLPKWHPGAGGAAFIFVDELLVE